MRLREYIALFIALVCMLNQGLQGQSMTVSVELNNPSNILTNWEKGGSSMRVNVNNKTNKLLLATFYVEITNQDGAIANNGEIAGEFIELRPGNNRLLANKLLPAFGINYIRGLPNVPLEGGDYEICVSVDISGNAIEGETVIKGCSQWKVEQSASTDNLPKTFSGASLRSPENNLEVTQVSNRAIRFSWNAISPRPNFSVTYMLLVYPKIEGQTTSENISEQAPILELPVVGANSIKWPSSQPLLRNGDYIWTVRPVNSIGESLLPPPGISEARSFKINCDIRKLLPKTRDGLFALDLPTPSRFSLLGNQSTICWEPLPLPELSYQVNYTKAICDSIISDDAPYPFAPFIPSNADEAIINQATKKVDELETELQIWQNFANKHVQRFVWTEQELEMWEDMNQSLNAFASNWPGVLDTLDATLSCDQSEVCCGDNDCCKGLNPCFKSERELLLSRLICQEDQLDRLRREQIKELIGILGVFTRQHATEGAQLPPAIYTSYFQIYQTIIQLFSYFESKNLQQHKPFIEVLNKYPNFQEKAPGLYQRLLSAPVAYWQVLSQALTEAEANAKLLPSSLLVGLDEYLRHISPELNDVMGKTRAGIPKSLQDFVQGAYSNNQCLIAFSNRKKEHLEACQDFSLQVTECLKNAIENALGEKNALIEKSVAIREAYWNSVSDSIQTAFEQSVNELGSRWKQSVCIEGGKLSLPGAQTPSAVALKEVLTKKLGRKICYLNFIIEVDCINPEQQITLKHSYPLLRRNENCCSSQTELSWQSGKIAEGESEEDVCLDITSQDIADTFNKQLAILNPKASKLNNGDIYAGRWSLTAFDSTGVMQAYSPTRILELETIQENDLMLELKDTTNCGCRVEALMNGKSLPSTGRMLITQPGQVQKISISGACEGGCPAGPSYVAIIPPAIQQIVKGNAEPISLPIITFHESTFDYTFSQTGVYGIQIKQVCNGYACTETYEVEVRPTEKVGVVINEWAEQTNVENEAFCLTSFYKVEEDSDWSRISFESLSMKEKTKANFLIKSACAPNCEEIPQYEWKLIDTNGKEQIIGENSSQIAYHFKKAGTYKIILKEMSSCTSDNQLSKQQTIHIEVSK